MAITFGFFSDPGLTTPLASLQFDQAADGSTGPVDKLVYYGSPTVGKLAQAASNPGVDTIEINVVDADPGNGHPASEVKLATSAGGLASAVGGDPVTIGFQVQGGPANAIPIYIRVQDSTGVTGTSTELALLSDLIQET